MILLFRLYCTYLFLYLFNLFIMVLQCFYIHIVCNLVRIKLFYKNLNINILKNLINSYLKLPKTIVEHGSLEYLMGSSKYWDQRDWFEYFRLATLLLSSSRFCWLPLPPISKLLMLGISAWFRFGLSFLFFSGTDEYWSASQMIYFRWLYVL